MATPRFKPGDVIQVQGRPVRLAVNARARRIGLRLDVARREVVATAPSLRRLHEAAAFAGARADWIAAHLDPLPQAEPFRPGALIEVLGQPCRLERAAMRIRPRLVAASGGEPARLLAHGDDDTFSRAVQRALRTSALERLRERTAVHVARLGVAMPAVGVMDARGRWGSCRAAHRERPASVRYNWRLALGPPSVLDYVAAHECAHLIEANHGPRFWALVQELYGDPAKAKAWLRANGARLHAAGRG